MMGALPVPELPFPVAASQPGVWRRDEQADAVVATAPAHTDLYINPAGEGLGRRRIHAQRGHAARLATRRRLPVQRTGHASTSWRKFDAGVLLVWVDERTWAKFCFEFSPAAEPMVVSVVTRDVSDDANAFVVPDRSVWLRVSRVDHVYAFHASTDGRTWRLIRVFTLGDGLGRAPDRVRGPVAHR